jgi:hypothetical protein
LIEQLSHARCTASKIISENAEEGAVVSFVADKGLLPGEPKWANYVKGVVAEYFKVSTRGVPPPDPAP